MRRALRSCWKFPSLPPPPAGSPGLRPADLGHRQGKDRRTGCTGRARTRASPLPAVRPAPRAPWCPCAPVPSASPLPVRPAAPVRPRPPVSLPQPGPPVPVPTSLPQPSPPRPYRAARAPRPVSPGPGRSGGWRQLLLLDEQRPQPTQAPPPCGVMGPPFTSVRSWGRIGAGEGSGCYVVPSPSPCPHVPMSPRPRAPGPPGRHRARLRLRLRLWLSPLCTGGRRTGGPEDRGRGSSVLLSQPRPAAGSRPPRRGAHPPWYPRGPWCRATARRSPCWHRQEGTALGTALGTAAVTQRRHRAGLGTRGSRRMGARGAGTRPPPCAPLRPQHRTLPALAKRRGEGELRGSGA